MRIGLMLRSLDEKGGIGVYARNLTEELLRIDSQNDYVLLYQSATNLGRYADPPRVTERVIKGGHKLFWDQVAVPYCCWREGIDVLFHPKFTVPLLAPCKSIMVVHGADWFIPEQAQYYRRLDVAYIRAVMPLYFRKAAVVVSVSQLTTDNFRRVMNLPPSRIQTVYFGPARNFARVEDEAILQAVRRRYQLPEKFILTLTKRQDGGRKNFGRLVEAYAAYHRQQDDPHNLVVGGKDCDALRGEYAIPETGYGRAIRFPGWMRQEDLPAVYTLADLFLYPSNLEAFPIPITEAMACGTPIVTSNVNGLKEIAGDAAVFVDPSDAGQIAEAIGAVLGDDNLRGVLSSSGLARSREFNWEKCARRILSIIEGIGGDGRP